MTTCHIFIIPIEIKDMTNPFVSRSSEAVVNKDIYTATVRYEGTTDVKMGN